MYRLYNLRAERCDSGKINPLTWTGKILSTDLEWTKLCPLTWTGLSSAQAATWTGPSYAYCSGLGHALHIDLDRVKLCILFWTGSSSAYWPGPGQALHTVLDRVKLCIFTWTGSSSAYLPGPGQALHTDLEQGQALFTNLVWLRFNMLMMRNSKIMLKFIWIHQLVKVFKFLQRFLELEIMIHLYFCL